MSVPQPTFAPAPVAPVPPPTSEAPPVSQQSPATPHRPRKPADASTSPLPFNRVSGNALPSSRIKKDKLKTVESVIKKYPKLKDECKAGRLACKLAQEALFGEEVMKECTPIGNRDLPALPQKELRELKKVMFMQYPQYWKTAVEFEPVWKKCLEAVQQLCKRLRTP